MFATRRAVSARCAGVVLHAMRLKGALVHLHVAPELGEWTSHGFSLARARYVRVERASAHAHAATLRAVEHLVRAARVVAAASVGAEHYRASLVGTLHGSKMALKLVVVQLIGGVE